MYTPKFVSDVEITVTNQFTGQVKGTGQFVNPTYCLDADSAKELMALFPQLIASIKLGDPIAVGKPIYNLSKQVPFFVFANGASENAAFVAQPFTHGFPLQYAMNSAMQEIAWTMTLWDQQQGN